MEQLRISRSVAMLLEEWVAAADIEICGLLAGMDGDRVMCRIQPLDSRLQTTCSFAVNAERLFGAKRVLEREGYTVFVLYHSHPSGSTKPSVRDLELPRLTGLDSLILARSNGHMRAACHGLRDGELRPIEVVAPVD